MNLRNQVKILSKMLPHPCAIPQKYTNFSGSDTDPGESDQQRKLIIYPNGDDNIEGNDYISVYLAIANDSSLPGGWEANAVFSFFLFNHLCENYLVIRGQVLRFHKVKSKWGFSKFISHKALKEQSDGYLVDDSIIIGAEVFVVKSQ
ncbi:MATH domain and coiled-coil domain-containing protein At3g58250-like isoform X3 [Nicotiana tabacum]|uniref:MATH domain and coiled-coil domain-containing protein At3g58250-like isoform X3 n=3 Tax=Nicotiana tabacum TaxID=4097 RepID=A0AC58UGM0_TOBAC